MYCRVSVAGKRRGWVVYHGHGAGTGLEAIGMGRDQVRHMSPCSSVLGSSTWSFKDLKSDPGVLESPEFVTLILHVFLSNHNIVF